jgi:hypothetical protein
MKTIRIWLMCLSEPPFRLLNRILFRFMRYSRLRFGTTEFWGPRDFLDLCTTSVRRLQELDSELHARLTTQQKLMFWYDPDPKHHQYQAYGVWIFTINYAYVAYQSDGIIALLVYSAKLAALMPRQIYSKAMSETLHSEARATTRSWLETRHFPEPLVDCFREQTV